MSQKADTLAKAHAQAAAALGELAVALARRRISWPRVELMARALEAAAESLREAIDS